MGRVAEEVNLVLAAEGDELHAVAGGVAVGEEKDVMVRIVANGPHLKIE